MSDASAALAWLDAMKAELDARRPLPAAMVKNLRESLLVQWTYHSNAIEGNTLTLSETKVVLEGITVGGKTLTEHLEAINHREAILAVEQLVQQNEPLSEYMIKNIHALVLKGVDDQHVGTYRTINVLISGAAHTPPESLHVPGLMHDFIEWYVPDAASLHPVERAARVHSEFVRIHPFVDGNGRTGRLLMNLELMKAGFAPAVISVDQRLAYYGALDKSHTMGDGSDFLMLVCDSVKRAFEPYWFALGVGPGKQSEAGAEP